MQFTKEAPTKAGWYWVKPDLDKRPNAWPTTPYIVEVVESKGVFGWQWQAEFWPCRGADAEWAGPITPDTPSMRALLEKALPIIEAEADQRDEAYTTGGAPLGPYFTEMRDLANEIAAELDKSA